MQGRFSPLELSPDGEAINVDGDAVEVLEESRASGPRDSNEGGRRTVISSAGDTGHGMTRRSTAANAVFAGLFGMVVASLAVPLSLVFGVFPSVGGPDQLALAGLATIALGGVVVGVPAFVLFERTILGVTDGVDRQRKDP